MHCYFHSRVFCHLLARQLLSMGALSPRRRRCSSALQRVYRVLAAMSFCGLILWLAVQSDPHPAPLFAHFFWQDRKSGSAKQQLRFYRKRGTAGANRADRPSESSAPTSCRAESPAEQQLRFYRIQRHSGENGRAYSKSSQRKPPLAFSLRV